MTEQSPTPGTDHPAAPEADALPLDPATSPPAGCPVTRDDNGAYILSSHRDVTGAALDHRAFSNAVSRFLQVPNGLDGPRHSLARAVVDKYFAPDRMAAVTPDLERVAAQTLAELDLPGPIDAVEVGSRYAVRAQSVWLGWPADLEDGLLQWMADNHAASRSGERVRTAEVAQRFDQIIRSLIAARRGATGEPADITAELMADRTAGRPLTDEEIVSILRNWTGGDLGSMALCAGVVLVYLADHPEIQDRLRAGVSDREFDAIVDEILRIDDPFTANRRITTEDVTVSGCPIPAGERVYLNWTAANRDPEIFGDPDRFDPERNAPYNLVWGIGKHVCPGRPLALLELRVFLRAALAASSSIEPDPDRIRERELPPVGGYAVSPVVVR